MFFWNYLKLDKKFAKFFCSATNPLAAGEGNRLYDIIYRVYIVEGWILSLGGFKLGLLIAV